MIYFDAVDKNDHNSSFPLVAIQTIHYYLIIFLWAIDRVVYNLFVSVCYIAKSVISKIDWGKYPDRNNYRNVFQIDLFIFLINFVTTLKWDEEVTTSRLYASIIFCAL